jgi:hypothetical protein
VQSNGAESCTKRVGGGNIRKLGVCKNSSGRLKLKLVVTAMLAAGVVAPSSVRADVYGTFDIEWSAAASVFGGSATASAVATIDVTTLNDISLGLPSTNPVFSSLTMTVSGATVGNGTFTLSDFSSAVAWGTDGVTLDFTRQLVGQSTPGGPWGGDWWAGDDTCGCDFNLFNSNPSAPNGIEPFFMATNGGTGDPLQLYSFEPVSGSTCSLAEFCAATPLPAALPLFVTGLGALGLFGWRRKRRAAAIVVA